MPHILDSRVLERSQLEGFIRVVGKLAPVASNLRYFRELLMLHSAESFFESHVISELGILSGITASDLTKILHSQVLQDDPNSSEFCSRFRAAVTSQTQICRRSRPIALQPAGHFRTVPERWEDIKLWQSEDERFAITIVGLLPSSDTAPVSVEPEKELREEEIYGVEKRNLYVSIEGVSTERFFDEYCVSVADVLSTLVRCLTLLNDCLFADSFGTKPLAAGNPSAEDASLKWFKKFKTHYASANTISKDRVLTNRFHFVKHALDLFFLDASTKGARKRVSGRLKNAIRLLMESDRQAKNEIGLALSVSAIEALVTREHDDVARNFKEAVAILVESDPNHRPAAEAWINKNMYARRSGVLHGSQVDFAAEDALNARIVAGTVVKAILERDAAMSRLGYDEKQKDLLDEIRADKDREGGLTHAEPIGIKWPWR